MTLVVFKGEPRDESGDQDLSCSGKVPYPRLGRGGRGRLGGGPGHGGSCEGR